MACVVREVTFPHEKEMEGEGPPAERDAKGDLISPFIPNGVQQIEAPIRRRRSPDRSGENQRRQSGPGGHSSSHRGHSSHGGRGSAFEIQTQVFEVPFLQRCLLQRKALFL